MNFLGIRMKNSGFLAVAILCGILTLVRANAPPKIMLPPRNQYVLQNTKATFVCETSGQPLPEITWLRNRRPIKPGRRKFRIINLPNRSILRIIPSGKKDMNITCKANNGIGRPVIKSAMLKNLEAVPSGFPVITINPTMRALFEGRDTVMICSADGYPIPTVSWLKDDLPVDMGNPRLSMLPTGGSLHISKVEETDGGLYECVAQNAAGTAYSEPANLFVRVQDLPPTFYTEPRDEDVPIGGSVNLTCAAAGRPTPEIVWREDENELKSTLVTDDGTNILQLTNINETKNYTCFAFSKMGFAVSTVTVQAINASEPHLNVPPRNIRLTLEERQPPKIRVDWDSSPMASRLLNGHIVQYYKRGPLSGDIREAFVPVGTNTFLSSSLDYDAMYDFSVTPMWTDPTKRPLPPITSTMQTPTEVTTAELPLTSPTNVTVDDYDCRTGVAILSWGLPANHSDVDITHYLLWRYTEDGKPTMTKVQSSEYAITGLSSDEKYKLSVQAVDDRGPGEFSQNVTIHKCETKTFTPKDIRIRRLSGTSIEVSWVNPDDENADKEVQGYKILYRVHASEDDPASWLSKDVGPNAMTILNNLTQNDVYEIRLQAKNRQGYGQASEAILSPKTSAAQIGVGVMFGRPSLLGTRARIICTIRLKLPEVTVRGNANLFSVVVIPTSHNKKEGKQYTAATFTELPELFDLGDGRLYGDVYNRPLEDGFTYRVYVKAFTDKKGYFLVSEESETLNTHRCQTNILTQGSAATQLPLLLILLSSVITILYSAGNGT